MRAPEACYAVLELSRGSRLAHSVRRRRSGLLGELKLSAEGVDTLPES